MSTRERDAALKLLKDFQSRDLEHEIQRPWEVALSGLTFYKICDVNRTDYYSDKDDPETRSISKRPSDPDGVQGILKYFTHKHSGGVGLYTTMPNYIRIYSALHGAVKRGQPVLPAVALTEHNWPGTMTFLATLAEITLDLAGKTKVFKPASVRRSMHAPHKDELQLWAYPDTHTLLAWRSPNTHETPGDEVYLWRGGHLHVTERGIQG